MVSHEEAFFGTSKKPFNTNLILTDRTKLFLVHSCFDSCCTFRKHLVPRVHTKMDKILDIIALKKGNSAKALGIYCHHLVWCNCSADDILKSSKGYRAVYDQAIKKTTKMFTTNCLV